MKKICWVLAIGCALAADAQERVPPVAEECDWTSYVLPEMGTVNTHALSTGNLYPAIARPWGAGLWTPQTVPNGRERWFYDYTHPRIYGLRHTYQPSPWIGDWGAWSILPLVGRPGTNAAARASWFSHKAETMTPALYRVYLAEFDVTAALAPTAHGAAFRFDYPAADAPGFVVDTFGLGEAALSADGRRVTGWTRGYTQPKKTGTNLVQRFVLELDRAATAAERLPDGALWVRFAPMSARAPVELRVGTSLISDDFAVRSLAEADGGLDAVVASARAEWNRLLGRVRVQSDSVDRLRVFYTCLYRALLFPRSLGETDAGGAMVHFSLEAGDVRPGPYFGGTGFWDTFRALYPLLNFLYPEMSAQMMAGLENCWKESGWLPEWSSPGLVDCMVGNNSASVVAGAWLDGVRGGFDINELYRALVHGANNAHPTMKSVGRLGVEHYNAKGYVPRDVGIKESAARTLEYAYDDWCIAALARAIGRPQEEVDLYATRARNWRNVFDSTRRIAAGRNADGSFNADFDPFAWGGDFTEGCALHYTWSVFHDVGGLCAAMGGRKEFERRLDEIFTLPPKFTSTYYHTVIHEMREMQVMGFGQYAHGNQPIQHMIYLYDWTDAPEKAGRHARDVMDRLYAPTPDGYCGDEDNGQTSAWFVWSSMGLYPVCPGSGEYATGVPLFDRIDVALPNGRALEIRAPGAESRRFPAAPVPRIRRADLLKGGTFQFGALP